MDECCENKMDEFCENKIDDGCDIEIWVLRLIALQMEYIFNEEMDEKKKDSESPHPTALIGMDSQKLCWSYK